MRGLPCGLIARTRSEPRIAVLEKGYISGQGHARSAGEIEELRARF